jgi:glucosamine kinase
MSLILAIDGGGTSCRAAIADPSGAILGLAKTGPANIATDPSGAAANIVAAAAEALRQAGRGDTSLSELSAYLGLAGLNVGSAADAFARRLPFKACRFDDDADIAIQGALGDDDGMVAVLGTGSVYLGRNGGETLRAGGWGFVVGDLGSGARLGRALLQDTLLAFDRIMPRSPLTRLILSEFGDDPVRLVAFAQNEKPAGFARFAPMVFEYAERGDIVASALVRGAVAHVDAALAAVTWPGCKTLCLLGGLSQFYSARIDRQFQAILKPAKADALTGAVELARRAFASDRGKD